MENNMRKFLRVIQNAWEAIGAVSGVAIMVYEFVTQLYADRGLSINTAVWIGLGLFVFFATLAMIKASRKSREEAENLPKGGNRSSNQSGGVTGNVMARDVHIGDVHYHGKNLEESQKQKSPDTEDYKELYQPHQIKEGETWESISEKEYGSAKFAKRIQYANGGRISLPKGSIINVPTLRLSSIQREKGKYVSLKVVNGNREKPMLCKAIITKMERIKEGEWLPIETDESGPLSWHHGGSDRDGFKEVFLSPEFINIARLPSMSREKNLFIRQNIVFTHLVDRPHKAGRYRMLIEVQYRFGDKPRIEKWFGYIDTIDITDSDNCKLTITEMEDINEWK